MPATNQLFEPAAQWDFLGYPDFEAYRAEFVPELRFASNVPEDIREQFSVVRKLLEFGYYEYGFMDVAAAQALFGFEMGLKLRYTELTGTDAGKRMLGSLMPWFKKQKRFEADNKKFLDLVRDVRNRQAHPKQFSVGGFPMKQWVMYAADLINDVYDDRVELRQERKQQQKAINVALHEHMQHGALFATEQGPVICYAAGVYFIDNTGETYRYYGFAKMIFPLTHERDKNSRVAPTILQKFELSTDSNTAEGRMRNGD